MLTIGIIGDYDRTYTLHLATDTAVGHTARHLGWEVSTRWMAPAEPACDLAPVREADALICAPGGPYSSLSGALDALRYGRENGVPTLGTCGGCQHMIVEYARNVLGIDAKHAEYDPDAPDPVVSALTCSLVGRTGTVALDSRSKVASAYGVSRVQEQYFCSFGLNPVYQQRLHEGGFIVAGRDADDDVARILELPGHPFYVATLFVPQARSAVGQPHPLLVAMARAARQSAQAARR